VGRIRVKAVDSAFAGSPIWCNVVNYLGGFMTKTRGSGKSLKTQSKQAVRASISFPPELYEILEDIAKQKKVSLAWVVRDAAEKYVANPAARKSTSP
jgi:hypothetical protein